MISIRSSLWLFNLLMVGAVSYSSAVVSTQVFKRVLEENTPPRAVARRQTLAEKPREKLALAEFQTVLDTNVFKARRSVVSIAPVAPPPGTTGPASPPPVSAPPPASLNVTLKGTVRMGSYGFAMVADPSGRNENLYSLGDCLPADDKHPSTVCTPTQGKLVEVKKELILVSYQDRQLTFHLTDKAPVRGAAPPPRKKSVGRATRRKTAKPATGSTATFPMFREGNVIEVRVPNAEVQKSFENFSDVLKQARVVPYTGKNGPGFQIRNIRPGSIFQRIGLNNNDVIQAVNGEPITTADQALRLLTMFRNEREIALDLNRRNENIKLNYIIE